MNGLRERPSYETFLTSKVTDVRPSHATMSLEVFARPASISLPASYEGPNAESPETGSNESCPTIGLAGIAENVVVFPLANFRPPMETFDSHSHDKAKVGRIKETVFRLEREAITFTDAYATPILEGHGTRLVKVMQQGLSEARPTAEAVLLATGHLLLSKVAAKTGHTRSQVTETAYYQILLAWQAETSGYGCIVGTAVSYYVRARPDIQTTGGIF